MHVLLLPEQLSYCFSASTDQRKLLLFDIAVGLIFSSFSSSLSSSLSFSSPFPASLNVGLYFHAAVALSGGFLSLHWTMLMMSCGGEIMDEE